MELKKLSKANAAVLVRLQAGDFDNVSNKEWQKLFDAHGKQSEQLRKTLFTPDAPADVRAAQAELRAMIDLLWVYQRDHWKKSDAKPAAWEAEQAAA